MKTLRPLSEPRLRGTRRDGVNGDATRSRRHTPPHGARGGSVAAGVKPRAKRPNASELRATVAIGGESFEVRGRASQLIAELVLYEQRVNEPKFGRLEVHFGSGGPTLFLVEGLPSHWLRPDLDRAAIRPTI